MRIVLWGTRGSLASPGSDTAGYGGNTACVQVHGAPDECVLVLDAGTGIRALGIALCEEERPVHVLLSHLHLDHIQGLGFFAPLFQSGPTSGAPLPPAATSGSGSPATFRHPSSPSPSGSCPAT